jgi:imidazolonepropionase-like amidohydrolase
VALVRAGLTPLEALQASTRSAAEFFGRLADEGTVEVGKKANFVLLEANPLTDIANTRRVAAVVLRGRLISGADLQRLR